MSPSAASIASELPYLRRFARALTGSQTSGDHYVVALLEALTTDAALMPGRLPPRVELYRAFLHIWGSLDVNLKPEARSTSQPRARAESALQAISPAARQAFLLIALEGFDTDSAAKVLDIDQAALADLIDRAGAEIANEVATDVLIIEDEPIIAMDIEQLVTALGHRVTGIARTHEEATAKIIERKPGLVLADVQLADGSSGLEAVNEILRTVEVPVIFITAYPERLLTGQRPEPTFLIAKPFQPDTVKAIISQALFFDQRARRPQTTAA